MRLTQTKEKAKPLSEEDREEYKSIIKELQDEGSAVFKPRKRCDCEGVPRPCPFVSCKYNTYLDVDGTTLRLNYGDTDVWETNPKTSCVLDIIDDNPQGLSNDRIGKILGVSRETIRLLEVSTKEYLRDVLSRGEHLGDSFTLKDLVREYEERASR